MRISIVAILTLAALAAGELYGRVLNSKAVASEEAFPRSPGVAMAQTASPSLEQLHQIHTNATGNPLADDAGSNSSESASSPKAESAIANPQSFLVNLSKEEIWKRAIATGGRSPCTSLLPRLGAQALMPSVAEDRLSAQPACSPSVQTRAVAQKTVRDIQIRFVDKRGQPFAENGQLIQGHTNKDFILGELNLKTGQVFRQETLESDLRRLRRMDLFRNVKVSLEEDTSSVNVVYYIQERPYSSISVGGGNSGDVGLFSTLSYRNQNLWGSHQQLRARMQLSSEDVQYSLRFTNPYRLAEPDRFGYSVGIFRNRDFSQTFDEDIDLPNGDDVLEGRIGGSVQLLRSYNDWNAAVGLNYTRISTRDRDWDVQRVDELGNPLTLSGTGIDELFTVSLGLRRDWRNSDRNATSGSLLNLSVEQSLPIGAGNIFMNRLRANYVYYLPVRDMSEEELAGASELAEVLAFNLQAGTVLGDLPPTEAFQLGGFNSVRGYGNADLATGRSFLLGSFEYRFPIVSSLGGVLFFDFGSDLGTGDLVIGDPAVLRNKPGSGFGYGIGVRVSSPLGLIRGDFGINDLGDMRFEIGTGQRF